MVEEGKVYTVVPEGWSSEGDAVARIDGLAVFVKGAIPGEKCRIFIEHIGHRAAWARVEALLEPAPGRVVPDCPLYGRCGGCQLRHMDYPTELEFKARKVAGDLRHIGGLEVGAVPIRGAAETCGYRNKVQFPVAPGPRIGYFQKNTHRVTDVERCALQPQWAESLRRGLKSWMVEHRVPAYDESAGTGLVRHLYARGNGRGESLCCVVVNGKTIPEEEGLVKALRESTPGLVGVVLNENTRATNVVLGPGSRVLWGRDWLEDQLCGLTFRLSVRSFYQVNRDQAEILYKLVGEYADLRGNETVLDLYCGTGTIGLTVADRAKRLVGVEIVPQAIADARENGKRNGLTNWEFYAADAAAAAADFAGRGERPDVIIVDPPRKGLAPAVVEDILAMGPARVVYVSCDPATLARDLKLLCRDYRLERAEAVDLFPRTAHVETVCKLTRRG